ncbi:P-loop ATPase, Sll1717 family [Desulfuromonas carbonis]
MSKEPVPLQYFVPPPYFDAIIGDPKMPNSSVVLAPRGAGKTAQRRMVEANARASGYLAVTYDRFEFSAGQKIVDISLQYHLRNIITRILISFFSYLTERPDLAGTFSKDEKKRLAIFVHAYLGDLTGDGLQELMKELRSLPEKFKDFWREHIGFMESVINFLLRNYDLEKIDFPEAKQEEKKLGETYKFQLETLLGLTRKIVFDSIYILIDKPDETEKTGNDPEKTYFLIQPIIRDLELLGLRGYGFKFFLWDQIESYYRADARPDRVPQYELRWSRASLKSVLSKRMSFFSDAKITSFDALLEEPCGIDDHICLLANGSPRNLIRLCERILAIQSDRDPQSEKISVAAIDQATVIHSEQVFVENYGEGVLKDLQRVGRELFTTNFVANDILRRCKSVCVNGLGFCRQ